MNTPPVISTQPASNVRPVLFKFALATAFLLAAVLLLDCAIHQEIAKLLFECGWYILSVIGMWLVFCLAVLVGELRSMILPASRAWSTSGYVDFIVIFCIFGCFLLPAFYFVALISMLHDYDGSGE